jgi:hypothetical protein
MWERQHVVHHIESCLSGRPECQAPLETPVCDDIKVA